MHVCQANGSRAKKQEDSSWMNGITELLTAAQANSQKGTNHLLTDVLSSSPNEGIDSLDEQKKINVWPLQTVGLSLFPELNKSFSNFQFNLLQDGYFPDRHICGLKRDDWLFFFFPNNSDSYRRRSMKIIEFPISAAH